MISNILSLLKLGGCWIPYKSPISWFKTASCTNKAVSSRFAQRRNDILHNVIQIVGITSRLLRFQISQVFPSSLLSGNQKNVINQQ